MTYRFEKPVITYFWLGHEVSVIGEKIGERSGLKKYEITPVDPWPEYFYGSKLEAPASLVIKIRK